MEEDLLEYIDTVIALQEEVYRQHMRLLADMMEFMIREIL